MPRCARCWSTGTTTCARFDEAFDLFCRAHGVRRGAAALLARRARRGGGTAATRARRSALEGDAHRAARCRGPEAAVGAYSAVEVSRTKDFAEFTGRARAARTAAGGAAVGARHPPDPAVGSRPRGRRVDLRGARAPNLMRGGDPLELCRAAAPRGAAPARAAVRRQRIDGALHPHAAALRPRTDAQGAARRELLFSTRLTRVIRGIIARVGGQRARARGSWRGARLVGRHAHRRRAADVQHRSGRAASCATARSC